MQEKNLSLSLELNRPFLKHSENGDLVARGVVRRDKKHTWVHKLEVKVTFIQKRMAVIEEEREKAVLECLLDGMSMVAIGRHMGLCRRHVYNLRDKVIKRMQVFKEVS